MAKKTLTPEQAGLPENEKNKALEIHKNDADEQLMTTDHGVRINDDQNSLKSGERGSTLLEDFILREKITHFDHERIPERVVHARGSGAHGVFKLYKAIPEYSKAQFLNDTSVDTPVFVRFSTVAGSKGSTDLARDVRGFAVKFYTQEGNFDLVGNNMPVFFIQDAMKFPDLIHAVKPEPDNEMPQAASAHDTFWDFISLMPESAHMVMWTMSDRALPRSYRMMEGFGVHSFRLVNNEGKSHFVKFHWKPLLGVHAVAWEEAQLISGKDPDFHRRDLWEAIQSGDFPEWELGIQIVPEVDEHRFDFDLLDPTKLIPEELVPVQKIGKLTLNRNPDNFFAETEQVAFHVGHVVPGIDFSNDPLMQGRLFSYTDTQLLRLGGPNFHEIPINRPLVKVNNNQRDGLMRQTINIGKSSYGPNSIANNSPQQVKEADGGFVSYNERIDSRKIRARSESFFDHYSQAKLFFQSQSEVEKAHIINALSFELGKVKTVDIKKRMIALLSNIDLEMTAEIANRIGVIPPQKAVKSENMGRPADATDEDYASVVKEPELELSPALSMANTTKDSIKTRKIAFLVADGADSKSIAQMKKLLTDNGATVEVVAADRAKISLEDNQELTAEETLLTSSSVFYDAVFVPSGEESIKRLSSNRNAVQFLEEAFRHCKAIAFDQGAEVLFGKTYFGITVSDEDQMNDPALIYQQGKDTGKLFVEAMMSHRNWNREQVLGLA